MVFVVLVWIGVSTAVAYRLTHRSKPRFEPPAPTTRWPRLESHRLSTRDGHEIGAWFVEGQPDAPGVLILHGNGGSRSSSLRYAEFLEKEGFAVLMISLRAHGDSTGDYNDIGYSAKADVVAAVDFLEARRPGRPIVVLGTSMGAAAAIFASGELNHRVAGYTLVSPYRDIKTAVWNRTDTYLPVGLSWAAYAGLRLVAPIVLPHLDAISPLEAIRGIPDDVPVLIVAGDADRLARLDEARDLLAQVGSHGQLVTFPNAGHRGLFDTAPDRFTRTVVSFCREASQSNKPGN
jgi:alpha-beta hydrolase superfamily lysophospholipase